MRCRQQCQSRKPTKLRLAAMISNSSFRLEMPEDWGQDCVPSQFPAVRRPSTTIIGCPTGSTASANTSAPQAGPAGPLNVGGASLHPDWDTTAQLKEGAHARGSGILSVSSSTLATTTTPSLVTASIVQQGKFRDPLSFHVLTNSLASRIYVSPPAINRDNLMTQR